MTEIAFQIGGIMVAWYGIIITTGVLAALDISRWGNFFNRELYGHREVK